MTGLKFINDDVVYRDGDHYDPGLFFLYGVGRTGRRRFREAV